MTSARRARSNAGMEVANPIYDVVFRYLMQNRRAARLLIGRIAGLAVQSLTPSPQTAVGRTPESQEQHMPLTLLRMYFAARVQTEDGGRLHVLIEIWKAKAPTVLEYFRRCLGQQIGSPGNILTHPSGRTEAVPIVTIYFLGYDLGLSDEPVIDVCPGVTERRTGRELEARHPLVEGIHNRSHIIQIPRLASRRRDELERVLAIFDQGPAYGNGWRSPHMLTIAEEEYPAECGFVLRQLREAIAEEEVRRTIEGEDVLFRDSILLAHQVAYHQRRAEQAEQGQQRAEQRRQQTRALSAGGPSPYGKSVRMPAPATTDAVALRGSTAALRSERAGDACFRVRRRCIRRRSSAREDPIRIASVRVRVLNGWVDGRSAMVGLPRLVDGWRAGFRRPPFQ